MAADKSGAARHQDALEGCHDAAPFFGLGRFAAQPLEIGVDYLPDHLAKIDFRLPAQNLTRLARVTQQNVLFGWAKNAGSMMTNFSMSRSACSKAMRHMSRTVVMPVATI
jgi:hypothetical protein